MRASSLRYRRGFTLVELLSVIAISTVMITMTASFANLRGSGNMTLAAYEVAGMLERARAHATAHNTYVWVGFYEEDAGAVVPTNAQPPYTGRGRVVISAVASTDGTAIVEPGAPPAMLPSSRVAPLARLLMLQNVHLAELTPPSAGTGGNGSNTETLGSRPDTAFSFNSATGDDRFNRISSDNSDQARHSFAAQRYSFYKTVRFSPRGEVHVTGKDGAYMLVPLVEIGLRPTHGSVLHTSDANIAAIQITGITGHVKIYRP
ncbi:MAG: Tfp pilus assembly protein FimT/FimU [Candidatus Methylacidiphilales bacterium]|nr:prepilin-type N-terminal cleavage/methylation domain-containing protein [Candidatus Methylacidiphilales bacterium]